MSPRTAKKQSQKQSQKARSKILLAGMLATFSSALVQAQDFQFEANGVLGFVSEDDGFDEADSDLLGLSGTIYFEAVSTKGGPLAEAGFIDQVSNATATVLSQNYDDGIPDLDGQFLEARIIGGTGLFLNLQVMQSEQGNDDADGFGFGVGYYVTDSSTLEGNLLSASEEDVDVNTYSVAYRHLMMQQSPYTLAIDANADFRESDDIDDDAVGFGAELTLYPSDALGLSVGFEHTDADLYTEDNLVLAADYFVQPNFRIGVEYLTSSEDGDNNNEDIDTDVLAFNAGVRF